MDSTNNININIYIGQDYPVEVEGTSNTIFNFSVSQLQTNDSWQEHLSYVNFDPSNVKWTNYTYTGWEDPLYTCQAQYSVGEYTMSISATTINTDDHIDRVYSYNIKIKITDNAE